MNKAVVFLRNHWFRAILSTMLVAWTVISLMWLLPASAPWYVLGHAFYDLIVEGLIAISLWLDVILRKK